MALCFGREAHIIFPPTFRTCFFKKLFPADYRVRIYDLFVNHPASLSPLDIEGYSGVRKKKPPPESWHAVRHVLVLAS